MRSTLLTLTLSLTPLLACGEDPSAPGNADTGTDDVVVADAAGDDGDDVPDVGTDPSTDPVADVPDSDPDVIPDAIAATPVQPWIALTSGAGQLSSDNYRLQVHVATPQPMAQRDGEQYSLWLGVGTPQSR